MNQPPRAPHEGVIRPAMLASAWLFLGAISAALVLFAYFVVRVDLLEDVAVCSGHDGIEQRLVAGVRREHQATDLWVLRSDLAADLDPVPVGEGHVEDRDVG
jgi:hypothetical protein